jgi:hypothetical protein
VNGSTKSPCGTHSGPTGWRYLPPTLQFQTDARAAAEELVKMNAIERLAIDLVALAGLVFAANPVLTGIGVHEWVGLAVAIPLIVHLIVNWDWVMRTLANFVRNASTTPRVNLVVDIALLVSGVAVTLSGALVVPGWAAAIGLPADPLWHVVHLVAADAVIGLTTVHFALHARWVVRAFARLAEDPAPARQPLPAVAATPVAAAPATTPLSGQ